MKDTPLRDEALSTRVRLTQKELAVLAARQQGVSLSEFVRAAVAESTARVLTPPRSADLG